MAVLGMVLGSFAVVQPVKASGDCVHFSDEWGCDYADCGECIAWRCPGGTTQIECDV
ncbi:hypothetical protein [Algoriphagus pacificus]|uniref:Uncharacterized protein n=1 Tax=Algoriphagus pacificus TaxID=2811234 RepID=A0ABS3CCR8_9BACT|nr:hypothetical protein [Algoriphagus pacificus]MBN7814848.1 hypothetical protein [Algoriphagus pacificus]